jgi:hypothetical protein
MARAPQSLQRIISADVTLAAWQARHQQENKLIGVIRRHLPRPLADRVRVADAQTSELQLSVEAGAIAAVLRQRTPELLGQLLREGWKFNAIRIRVQVRETPRPEKKFPLYHIDKSSLRPLAGLARELPDGPLKVALTRFLRRAG